MENFTGNIYYSTIASFSFLAKRLLLSEKGSLQKNHTFADRSQHHTPRLVFVADQAWHWELIYPVSQTFFNRFNHRLNLFFI